MSATSALSLTSSASDSPYDQLSYLLSHPNLSENRKHRPLADLVAENHKRLRRGVLADGIPEGEVQGVSSWLEGGGLRAVFEAGGWEGHDRGDREES